MQQTAHAGRPHPEWLPLLMLLAAVSFWPTRCLAQTSTTQTEWDRLEASYMAGSELSRSEAADKFLRTLVDRLRVANPDAEIPQVRNHVLLRDLPYAFYFGNGALFVSNGLLSRLQNESQLAAMIACELAAQLQHNNETVQSQMQTRGQHRIFTNLLLITATAGLAGIPIGKGDNKARSDLESKLQLASDTTALQWLRRAGYDPAEAPLAIQRLRSTLQDEDRFGVNTLSNKDSLAAREQSLTSALAAVLAETTQPAVAPLPAADGDSSFASIHKRAALATAYANVNADQPRRFLPVVERLEKEFGVDVQSTCLRATYLRYAMTDDAELGSVISAQEACVTYADAAPAMQRELAFLYRRQGNKALADKNFRAYLERAPTAADAAIIRGYLENP